MSRFGNRYFVLGEQEKGKAWGGGGYYEQG
jgi:hypothetical protein